MFFCDNFVCSTLVGAFYSYKSLIIVHIPQSQLMIYYIFSRDTMSAYLIMMFYGEYTSLSIKKASDLNRQREKK